MKADLILRYCARITLENTAPLSIGSGQADALFDVAIARDANSLPYLPGPAIAGLLRSIWREHYGDDPVELFGDNQSRVSKVIVSHGHIHNARNTPVDGLYHDRGALARDALLAPLLQDLPHRDHVALNPRGTADDRGKFDRSFVPVGNRFSFELSLTGNAEDEANWQNLLALLASPGFRLGGATRRAYGALAVKHLKCRCFDLAKAEDRAAYARLPARLDEAENQLQTADLPKLHAESGWQRIVLKLKAEDFWRAGKGKNSFSRQQKLPDALPYSERKVSWQGDMAQEAQQADIVLPGSSIKGALAHRIAFHHRRLCGDFSAPAKEDEAINPAVKTLFGALENKKQGVAGNVLIDDVRLNAASLIFAPMQHTSIDRFTGGVRQGVLYSEELIGGGEEITLVLQIRERTIKALDHDEGQKIIAALRETLNDLCAGRLALGAAQTKGHGFFSGKILSAPQWL